MIIACLLLSAAPISAQGLTLVTEVEDTPNLSLELLEVPSSVKRNVWLNWTLRLGVTEYNNEWNTSDEMDHPSLTILLKSPTVNFSTYNNVSFGLNRTFSWVSLSGTFVHYLHVFWLFKLGNMSGVSSNILIPSIRIGSDMPDAEYTLRLYLYDPHEATTITSTTTTSSTTTQIPTTSETTTPTLNLNDYYLPIGIVVLIAIVVLAVKARR